VTTSFRKRNHVDDDDRASDTLSVLAELEMPPMEIHRPNESLWCSVLVPRRQGRHDSELLTHTESIAAVEDLYHV